MQAATKPTRDQVVEALSSVGFTPQLQAAPVGTLSGGWKMKLALGECEYGSGVYKTRVCLHACSSSPG